MKNFESRKKDVLDIIAEALELPDSAHEMAIERYKDIGEWLARSELGQYDPHIFPQGSERYGTAIKPIIETDAFDVDLACELRKGVTKTNHSQFDLKQLLGNSLEEYRTQRGIKEVLEEKHRCWRLNYADKIGFHMDIVPCIPSDENRRSNLSEALLKSKLDHGMIPVVSKLEVDITYDEHPLYKQVSQKWPISNPEGYARWFESRLKIEQEGLLLEKALSFNKASIDEIPTYQWKTPLQRAIQLLKRHRDITFSNNPDSKPISIIITTLAAHAYAGESDIRKAVSNILDRMAGFVGQYPPRIPNPVNPEEDFADRWAKPEGKKLNLEGNFVAWLAQAKTDFKRLLAPTSIEVLANQIQATFGLKISPETLSRGADIELSKPTESPNIYVPKEAPRTPAWLR